MHTGLDSEHAYSYSPCIQVTCFLFIGLRSCLLPVSKSYPMTVRYSTTRNASAQTAQILMLSRCRRTALLPGGCLTCIVRHRSFPPTTLPVVHCLPARLPWVTLSCWRSCENFTIVTVFGSVFIAGHSTLDTSLQL